MRESKEVKPHLFTDDMTLFTELMWIYFYRVDEPWKCYGNWNELDTRDHILYDFVNMKYPK